MDTDFNFFKISQKLNERRSGHRSLVFKNQVIHVGGKYEQNIEIWYLQPDGDFEIISSDFITDGWSFFPEFFIVEEDEFEASLLEPPLYWSKNFTKKKIKFHINLTFSI